MEVDTTRVPPVLVAARCLDSSLCEPIYGDVQVERRNSTTGQLYRVHERLAVACRLRPEAGDPHNETSDEHRPDLGNETYDDGHDHEPIDQNETRDRSDPYDHITYDDDWLHFCSVEGLSLWLL